ncbi:MAG: hypothetical protein OXI87_16990 [Albidovulum sp.]|nr:hypothetical protein [Albidovulum sp.]MDE0531188.1 hypothetical protein [Albidovulum sp.]
MIIGMDSNALEPDGRTPPRCAVMYDSGELVAPLLDVGADPTLE